MKLKHTWAMINNMKYQVPNSKIGLSTLKMQAFGSLYKRVNNKAVLEPRTFEIIVILD